MRHIARHDAQTYIHRLVYIASLTIVIGVSLSLGCSPPTYGHYPDYNFEGYAPGFRQFDYGRGIGILDDHTLIVEQPGGMQAGMSRWDIPDNRGLYRIISPSFSSRYSTYFSTDGGSTWQLLYVYGDDGWQRVAGVDDDWSETIHWGQDEYQDPDDDGRWERQRELDAPRGKYAIEEVRMEDDFAMPPISIVRIEGDSREVVYSPPHLEEESNQRYRDRYLFVNEYFAWRAPQNLIYHPPSDNIVAVLGLEAVVVGDAVENWRPVLSETTGPGVDVSLSSKFAFVFGNLWPVAMLIALTATAAALFFVRQAHNDKAILSGRTTLFLTAASTLVILLAIIYSVVPGLWKYELVASEWGNALVIGYWVFALGILNYLIFPILGTVPLAAVLVIWKRNGTLVKGFSIVASLLAPVAPPVAAWSLLGILVSGAELVFLPYPILAVLLAGALVLWRRYTAVVGASSLVLACITSVGSLAMFLGSPWLYPASGYALGPILGLPLVHGFLWSIIALISFLPPFVRQWHLVLAALGGIVAIVMLAFAVGVVQGFSLGAAKLYTVALVIPAVWSLRSYLVKSGRSA